MSSSIIIAAAGLAENAHAGQTRRDSGVPYIVHPMRVAGMVTLWAAKQNPEGGMYLVYGDMIAAAWLHDVAEDTVVTVVQIQTATNANVAKLVMELTNASMGLKEPRAVRKQMDRDKLKLASREAKIIKMFDRIDNLGDLAHDDSFGMKYAEESILLADAIGDADRVVRQDLIAVALNVFERNKYNSGKCLGCEIGWVQKGGAHVGWSMTLRCDRVTGRHGDV